MKIIVTLLLLMGLSLTVCSKPVVIGKDQASINAHDYAVLKKVAENAQYPIEKFRHLNKKRADHFIVGLDGFLYRDRDKNGSIDGEDSPSFISISAAPNSYMTDEDGYVVAIKIKNTSFRDMSLLNGFKKILAINLTSNSVDDINLSDLPELRFLNIFERNNSRIMSQFSNLGKLTFFEINGLSTTNFKKFTGLKSLRKIDISFWF